MAERPKIIEYQPSLAAKVSGYVGRWGTRRVAPSVEATTSSPSLNEVLDSITERGLPPADEASLVIDALHASPRLKAPLFIQGLPPGDRVGRLPVGEEPVYLPTSNFVYAAGMEDWTNGHGRRADDSLTGAQRIRHYARKRSAPPPISFVSVGVQPDGLALYSSIHNGGHRVAAAHLRDDPFVPVGSDITIYRLPHNIVPPEYRAQP